jgi:uncharacterized protein (DUF488 family)
MNNTIFTIGHSTRPFESFLEILTNFKIELVCDVRTIPKSRYNPQFNTDILQASLEAQGIAYIHLKGLGGLRKTSANSINKGWNNSAFRGYADYMQTTEFSDSLQELINLAHKKVTVIMCAEIVPWRCHRSLIGDALLIRDFKVEDIISDKKSSPHKLTPWARVDRLTISYPENTSETEFS